MDEQFLAIIQEHRDFLEDQLRKQNILLERGELEEEEYLKEDKWRLCLMAILRDYEYMIEYQKDTAKDFRSFALRCEQHEGKFGKWLSFYTVKKILVKGEENLGPQEKCINVILDDSIKEQIKGAGYLVVKKCDLTQPYIYEIKEENGKKKYPYIYVKAIYSFTPEPVLED